MKNLRLSTFQNCLDYQLLTNIYYNFAVSFLSYGLRFSDNVCIDAVDKFLGLGIFKAMKNMIMHFNFSFYLKLLMIVFFNIGFGDSECSKIIDGIFRQQEKMEREIADVIFDAKYYYLETDTRGEVKKSNITLRRVYMKGFEKQKHEFLAMRVNNRELSPEEMAQSQSEWRRQETMIKKTKMPFLPRLRKDYEYFMAGEDTSKNLKVWKIGFRPKRRREGYVRGFACVSEQDSNVVRLQFVPVRLPFVLKNFQIIIDYARQDGYWLPAKFSMETDVQVKIILTFYQRHISIKEEYSNYRFNNGLNDDFFD